MKRFYFVDNNYPEELYYGTQRGFDWIAENGGFPEKWNGPTAPVGQTVNVGNFEGQPIIWEVVLQDGPK